MARSDARTHEIDSLELVVRGGSLPWDSGFSYPTVDLVLDGRPLQDWLSSVERAATGEARDYLGHPIGADMRALLMGEWSGDGLGPGAGDQEDFDGRTALLGCTCTVIGCGPLCARIVIEHGTVAWRQLVRYRGPYFDYGDLAFEFRRGTYESTVARWERDHPRRW
ncbi:MAG: hypothetical protein LWW86_08740 [Micrococcales bacterium]|nr:hypothetical protein [Micrococcales bacterium]